jgi:hypothetical protein
MAVSDQMRGRTAYRRTRRRGVSLTSVAIVTMCLSGLTVVGLGASPAQATSGAVVLYVATTGSNTDNNCQSQKLPCKTISYAVEQQGTIDHGGTIHVARGTYSDDFTLGPSNSSVTILGAGTTKTIIQAPTTGLASTTDPNGGLPIYSIIEADGGASNITLENFTVNGASGEGQLASTGCSQEYAGVYFDGASGTISKVAVAGIDMPATDPPGPTEAFDCPGESRGVYVASAAGPQPSTMVTMTGVSMLTPACTTTTTISLAAGTSYSSMSPGILPVKHLPKGKACKRWVSGEILIDGAPFQANAYGPHNLQITGSTNYSLPAGSAISAEPFASAYGDDGIECADANTTCVISDSVLEGEGPTDLVSQTGIDILGASATVSGNKVSANSFTGGGTSTEGAGIRALDDGTVDLTGNTLTANDEGINAAWSDSLPLTDPSDPITRQPTPEVITSGETTAGQDTLTSTASGPFAPSDVGRSVTLTESPSAALAPTSVGVTLPASTINVSETTGFVLPGVIDVPVSSGTTAVTCTGSTTTAFTGCTGGTGTTVAGSVTEAPYAVPLGYVAQYVSANVEILSQAASLGGSGETITLGALPGQWDISGNTASDGTALGNSAGTVGFGDGVVLDSTDSCASDPNQNADVVVEGNTANDNAADGFLVMGASCATVGAASQPNKATANDVGLAITGPGSACSPCTSSSQLGYDASDNMVVDNVFSGNDGFGVSTGGVTEPQSFAGPPSFGPGATGNVFNGNMWRTNSLANVVDFNAWGGLSCLASSSGNTVSPLTAGVNTTTLTLGTALTAPAGTLIQISQTGDPTIDTLLTAAASSATSVTVTPFTPTATYGSASVEVTILCQNTLESGGDLTAGAPLSFIDLTTPVTLSAGSLIQVSQTGSPTLNLLVTGAVSSSSSVPVVAFTPAVTYSVATTMVTVNPFDPTYPFASNSWGKATSDSCDPTPGSSAAFQGITYNAAYVSC